MILEINYSSLNGLTQINGVRIKTQSPKGSLRLTKQGFANQLQKQLQNLSQDLKQSYSDTLKCDKIYTNDFFSLCNLLGCDIIGTQEEKQQFLRKIEIDNYIQDATKILYDDCGAEIWSVALFKDSKNYYKLQCVRTWPGYEP